MNGVNKMQITIVQAEMELAIINHLRSIMTINDGMDISIDLSATRGAEGFKATIDITPRSMETHEVPSQPVVAAKPTPKAAVQAAKAETAPAPVEQVDLPAEAADPAPIADEPEAGLDQTSETVVETQAAEEAPKAKSLFGDVKRPVSA